MFGGAKVSYSNIKCTEAEFKEFEPGLKFETRLKYGWFHLKSRSMFQDLTGRSIETGFWRILEPSGIFGRPFNELHGGFTTGLSKPIYK